MKASRFCFRIRNMEIEKSYNPKEAEETHYERWEKNGCFAPEINKKPDAVPFSIVIPPPNVTGSLHMGHALQHTIMDVLTRWKRMQGFKTLWLPGTDHAGISTQLQVTKKLLKEEKKTRWDLGREEFTNRVWDWKKQYGGEITRQIRREGASVDWSRERFTMDASLSKAVREVFCTLFEEGWIYRGKRIVNWCPKDKTVLSDLEVKEETRKDGKLVYLKYPIKNSTRKLTVATTRPETMLGDSAVAVNPKDERYADLIGEMILLPLTNREIPIVADEYVDAEFGTGAVKITPAHDPNDYELGLRHNLPQIVVMNDDATMNANAGSDFKGLDRYVAREKVIEKFEELGLLEKIDDYEISLPCCERCKTVLEPILSEQWFVKMDEMRDIALDLMKTENSPRFSPEVPHTKVYTNWLENLKDWTISRQLWWGHQIPAWYDEYGNVFVARTFEQAKAKAQNANLTQDEDVLDTWFSSGLWAFSTFGWNGEVRETDDLNDFCTTDVLVTGRDIIFLWVSRMVMMTKKFVGKKPFRDVIVTGTVLDKNGQRMSKTKGNGVDPLDVFEKYGVDATRLTLAGSSTGADFRWRDENVEQNRNFANKIWNATRFCLMNSEGAMVDHSSLMLDDSASIADKWIISTLNKTAISVNKELEKYQFHTAVNILYHFFWDDFCDWYIELVKDEISSNVWSDETGQMEPVAISDHQIKARTRILTILEIALRMLHPFMPFLTEELWLKLPDITNLLHHEAYRDSSPSIMLASFPSGDESAIDEKAESEMQAVIELISKVRNIRAEMSIKPSERLSLHVLADTDLQKVFADNEARILKIARASNLYLSETLNAPKASAKAALSRGAELAIPLEGLIDFDKERNRLENQVAKLEIEGNRLSGQLSNEGFVKQAPPEKVVELRERLIEIKTQTNALSLNLEALK
jgi:valyl-tRNA synthetase